MGFSVCPAAAVEAPLDVVWELASSPQGYRRWWPAEVDPGGTDSLARPGQIITVSSRALGRRWRVNLRVEMVDPPRHQIRLRVALPFGMVEYTHVSCAAVDDVTTRVQYG
jgi:hypothetical protein